MIVLMGAAGETGRRIVRYARDQGIRLRLGARDVSKARAKLGALAEGWDIDTMTADSPNSISDRLEPGDVLLNATTPSGALGHSIARAAISSGAHYASFTGELIESRRLQLELDAVARERGVTLCPGCGCFPTLGDLAVRLALRTLPTALDGVVGYSPGGFGLSYGSLLSEMFIMGSPALIIEDGQLIERDIAGQRLDVGNRTMVFRPLMDPLMVHTYSGLRNFRSGLLVSRDQGKVLANTLTHMARALRSEAGRAAYLQEIASKQGDPVIESSATDSGTVTAILSRSSETVQVTISAQPIYEQAAGAALLVARELDEIQGRPAGFQAASSVIRSVDHALERLKVRLLS